MAWRAFMRPNASCRNGLRSVNEHLRFRPCRITIGAPHAPGFPMPVKPRKGRNMPDSGPGRGQHSWFANKKIHWGARGVVASLLAGGVANAFAAKGNKEKNATRDKTDNQEPGADGPRDEARQERAERRAPNRDEERDSDSRDRRDNNRDRERDSRDTRSDDEERSQRVRRKDRDETRSESEDSETDRVVSKRQNNNNNNNNNNDNNNNRNRDDEPDDTDSTDTEDDEDRGNRGNAGSGFFDQPLATKARRRANDFEGEGEEEDDGVVIDVDAEGESTYETGAIFFSTGPEGLEVVTRNISYTAAPTPTPTPFPRLELPERERLDVFGDRVLPTSTPAASAPTSPPPPPTGSIPADSGDTPPVSPPPPPPMDTSGGDTTGGFLS